MAGKPKIQWSLIEQTFLERNLILLSVESDYKNDRTKLDYICPIHNEKPQLIDWQHLKRGQGCRHCGIEKRNDALRKEFQVIIDSFNKRDYRLLEVVYKNSEQKLPFVCLKHEKEGTQYISWRGFNQGRGCKFCGLEKLRKLFQLDYNFIVEQFNERNYTLLEDDYMNANQRLKYICNLHPHKPQYIKYNHLKDGHGCKLCGIEKQSGENNWNWKGGITELNNYLRANIGEWKDDSMKSCEYKCIITGERFDDIHHLYSFDQIVKDVLNELKLEVKQKIGDYLPEELKTIKDKCLEIHYQHPLGVCLRKDIHKEFHKMFGNRGNTPEEFELFKQKKLIELSL